MKRPFEILKKRDKIRKTLFREDCKKAFAKEPSNCVYNLPVEFPDLGLDLTVCGYVDPRTSGKVTICNKTCQAKACPLFESRYKTVDDVVDKVRLERFRGINPLYLEADALDWVVDEEEKLAQESTSWKIRIVYQVIRALERLVLILKKARP